MAAFPLVDWGTVEHHDKETSLRRGRTERKREREINEAMPACLSLSVIPICLRIYERVCVRMCMYVCLYKAVQSTPVQSAQRARQNYAHTHTRSSSQCQTPCTPLLNV